jgi:hypothetical protein
MNGGLGCCPLGVGYCIVYGICGVTKKTFCLANNKTQGWVSVTQLFGGHVFTVSRKTGLRTVPPAITGAEYPNPWH